MQLLYSFCFGRSHDDRKHRENEDLSPAQLCGRCRKSWTYFLIMAADGADTNTHSACFAAKSFPRREAPAWYSTGVRCGEGSLRLKPGTLKYFPECSMQ